MNPASHFQNVPQPWPLPIVKHNAKFIVNQTYVDHKVYDAYPSTMGRFLHLEISRHKFPPTLEEHA
jgi:hypothetical protein